MQLQLLLGCSREEAGVLSRLVPSARSAEHEDDVVQRNGGILRTLLFEHRDADPDRAVARAIEICSLRAERRRVARDADDAGRVRLVVARAKLSCSLVR